MKIVVFCLSMIASFSSYAQSKVKVGLKINLGPYGLTNVTKEQDVDTYFNIGLTSHTFLSADEKFSIGIDFLYNYSSFTTRGDILNGFSTFSMKNTLIPFKANYHFKKWTFSAGLINSFVLDARFKNDDYEVKDGDLYDFSQDEIRLAYIHKKYDLQGIIGVRYAVSTRINLGVETTFYFAENDFKYRRTINTPFFVENFNYASLSCTATYFMN